MDRRPETLSENLLLCWSKKNLEDSIALRSADEELTYRQLRARVLAAAACLREKGVVKGDRVAVAVERSLQQVIWILAVLMAGACVCPLEPNLSREETKRRAAAVGLSAVLHDDSLKGMPLERCWHLRELRASDFTEDKFREGGWEANDAALLLFTSGSTGNPKGVLLSQGNLLANARGVIPHTEVSTLDRYLHVMPLHHSNGLNNQLFVPLLVGASVIFCPRFRAADIPALMERHKPTIITGVPTMYLRLLDQKFSRESLESLRFVRCGSALLTDEQQRLIERHLECDVIVSYGLSEATCTSTLNPPGKRKIGSIGTVLDGQNVFLRLSDGSVTTASGVEGEICISGPAVMIGYVGAKEAGFIDAPEDGVLRTGDIGRFDDEGYLYITGRIKDIIIRGGENLSPARIEGVLEEYVGVRQACVVGKPDSDLGEVPIAVVVRDLNALIEKSDLIDFVSTRLGRIYQPTDVFWVDALPENGIGKIDRKAVVRELGFQKS